VRKQFEYRTCQELVDDCSELKFVDDYVKGASISEHEYAHNQKESAHHTDLIWSAEVEIERKEVEFNRSFTGYGVDHDSLRKKENFDLRLRVRELEEYVLGPKIRVNEVEKTDEMQVTREIKDPTSKDQERRPEELIARLNAEIIENQSIAAESIQKLSRNIELLTQQKDALEVKAAALETALTCGFGPSFQRNEYKFDDSSLVIPTLQNRINELEDIKNSQEDTINLLRSELVGLKLAIKVESYQNLQRIKEYEMENEAKSLKVAVLEKEFREFNDTRNENERDGTSSIVRLDKSYFVELQDKVTASQKSIENLHEQIHNERAVSQRIEEELKQQLRGQYMQYSADEATAHFWTEDDLLEQIHMNPIDSGNFNLRNF